MSAYGVFHTILSLPPIFFGLLAFVQHRSFDPRTWAGKWYAITMFLGTVSAFGFLPTRPFVPGQVLTLITLAFLLGGLFTFRGTLRPAGYVQAICLTTTYLLLMVFTTTEGLTRLPVGKPFAAGPEDPALLPVRIGLLVAFAVALGMQIMKLRKRSAVL
jgi:hypothetical protein